MSHSWRPHGGVNAFENRARVQSLPRMTTFGILADDRRLAREVEQPLLLSLSHRTDVYSRETQALPDFAQTNAPIRPWREQTEARVVGELGPFARSLTRNHRHSPPRHRPGTKAGFSPKQPEGHHSSLAADTITSQAHHQLFTPRPCAHNRACRCQ